MAKARLSMRKIKEVLRLKFDLALSGHQIAHSCQISRSTVADYLDRFEKAGLGWPLPEDLSEEDLDKKLFPPGASVPSGKPLPDFEYIYRELKAHKKFNLTLDLLWREYKEQYPEGYQYTQFSVLYRRWQKKLDYAMRQDHRGGEKLFVDYGEGLSLIDPQSGEPITTQLFVAVWGEMASHYGLCVVPARPAHPKDKAKVETGVLIAKRWIRAVLRHRTFYSLAELNDAIAQRLAHLNSRKLRKLKQSRRELFELFDQPNALSVPEKTYEYAEWKLATVNIDYHIEIDQHYYSVPFRLVREKLHVRLTARTLEAFLKGERVAVHVRSFIPHRHSTLTEHMPPAHQNYLEWTPSRIVSWAKKTGPATAALVQRIIDSRDHPEQAYRSCLGILRLEKHYSPQRLENAALRALKFTALSFKALRNILENGLDRLEENPDGLKPALPDHENIRGSGYYH